MPGPVFNTVFSLFHLSLPAAPFHRGENRGSGRQEPCPGPYSEEADGPWPTLLCSTALGLPRSRGSLGLHRRDQVVTVYYSYDCPPTMFLRINPLQKTGASTPLFQRRLFTVNGNGNLPPSAGSLVQESRVCVSRVSRGTLAPACSKPRCFW